MKEYHVSYNLGNMYHSYVVEAENEAEAIQKVLSRFYYKELLTEFKIERYYPKW